MSNAQAHLVPLPFTKHIAVLLERATLQLRLLPQVGCQEAVGIGDSHEGRLERVLERLCRAGGSGVDVAYTCELEQTLDGRGGDQAGTAWGGDKLDNQLETVWLVSKAACLNLPSR